MHKTRVSSLIASHENDETNCMCEKKEERHSLSTQQHLTKEALRQLIKSPLSPVQLCVHRSVEALCFPDSTHLARCLTYLTYLYTHTHIHTHINLLSKATGTLLTRPNKTHVGYSIILHEQWACTQTWVSVTVLPIWGWHVTMVMYCICSDQYMNSGKWLIWNNFNRPPNCYLHLTKAEPVPSGKH